MTVESGFDALRGRIAPALTRVGFIPGETRLAIDDPGGLEPTGDETEFQTWAGLTRGETRAVRTILGRSSPRYVVEHRAVLDLAWAGPDQGRGAIRLTSALTVVAALVFEDPTLGGGVERFFLEAGEDEPLSPNGRRTSLICAFRIRSGDPLGLTD